MATTPKAGALSYYAASPEEEAAVQRYRNAQAELQEALVNRQQLFDPVLLAIAQGFLAPTRSGGFGESLANVAGMVGPVQSAEEKRAREIAQMKAELAAQELGMTQQTRRQRRAEELSREFMGEAPAGSPAPSGGAAVPGAAPAAAPGAAPMAAASAVGATATAPRGLRPLMESDIAAMYEVDPERAAMYEKLMRSQRGQFILGPKGQVFNTITGKYTGDTIPEEAVEYPTTEGSIKMLPSYYTQYQDAARQGLGTQWLQAYRSTGAPKSIAELMAETRGRPGATGAAPSAAPGAQGEGRILSQGESAVREAAAKEEAVAGAKSRAEQTAQVRAAGKAALGLIPIYDRMEVLLKAPGMDQIMGVLERGDVISALGSLVEEAVRVGNFSVGVPAVRKIVAQTGAPQDVIDRAAELGQLLAITQFEQRKGLGSGTSVSNFEQMMVNAMGPNMTDTLRSFGQKLNFLREKARFEESLAAALRKSKMQYEDFEDTPEFKRLFGEYQRRVNGIVYPGQRPFTVQR